MAYRGLLPLNPRNVAALAVKPSVILIHMRGGGRRHSSRRISAFQSSFWKINKHAEHVNGKQTFRVIKALVVTCKCGWVAVGPGPLERCPRLLGLVSVVMCLFFFCFFVCVVLCLRIHA